MGIFEEGAGVMGEAKRLIKNTGIIAVGGMATKLVSFFLLPLYTSVLSTADYGTVDYINTIALFLVPAVSLLMDEALFRFLIDCKTDEDRVRTVTASCAVLFTGCGCFTVMAVLVWLLFTPDNLGWVIGLVVAASLLQMASAVLRGFGDTVGYSVMNFVASAVSILLNVLFIAVLRWGVVGMLSAMVIAQGGTALVYLLSKRLWKFIDPSTLSIAYARDLLRYSIPLIPNTVSWTINNLLDRLIIMNTLGASAAGVYAVSYKFPSIMDQVYGFFYKSWKESSARALNADEDESHFYNSVYRALRRFMMSVVLLMSALMPVVYGVLIKGSFNEGLLYVPILLLATYYSNISGFYGGIFTAYKDTGIMGTTTVVSAILCAVLCVLLIPRFGLYGASFATLAAMIVVNEYRRVKVAKYTHLVEDRLELILTLAAIAAVFALYYLSAYGAGVWSAVACFTVALVFSVYMNLDVLCKLVSMRK